MLYSYQYHSNTASKKINENLSIKFQPPNQYDNQWTEFNGSEVSTHHSKHL